MKSTFRKIASLKITLVGMGLLCAGSVLSYGNPDGTSIWVLVVPMIILAINLVAAIATNPRINQQPGLLVFHVCLLLILLLAALGRLTHIDAHLELVAGTEFNPEKLLDVNAGPFHYGDIEKVRFVQGPYTVQYASGLRRGLTHSHVKVEVHPGQWEDRVVGDDRPLLIQGYRFYTTFNKGFAPILTWIPKQGEAVTGAINMPSYPLFDYKQDNRWVPPNSSEEIKFWLQLNTGMDMDKSWVLDGRTATGTLIVTTPEKRHEVQVGGSVSMENGVLRYDALTIWMGYRLFYDPTIQWMFFVSILGVLGLSHYFWKKVNLLPWMNEVPDPLAPDTVTDDLDSTKLNGGSTRQTNNSKQKIPTSMAAGEKH
jgi:cytochrome c biogenesis protein